MKFNRELDRQVAEKVFGFTVVEKRWGVNKQFSTLSLGEPDYYDDAGEMILSNGVPLYSIHMVDAWLIVEYILDYNVDSSFTLSQDFMGIWTCQFTLSAVKGATETYCRFSSNICAAHAICEAALIAAEALK